MSYIKLDGGWIHSAGDIMPPTLCSDELNEFLDKFAKKMPEGQDSFIQDDVIDRARKLDML